MAKDDVRTSVFVAKNAPEAKKQEESEEDGEIARGQSAKQARVALEESFESLRTALTKEMVDGKKTEDREQAWAVLKGLDRLKLELDKVVSRGEVASIKANKPL